MKFNFLQKIDMKKKCNVCMAIFLVIVIIMGLIVLNYGSKNKFGLDIFTPDKREEVGPGTTNSYNYSHDTEEISSIDIRWQSGKVTLTTGNKDEFRITETSSRELDHSNRLTIDGESGSLVIKWDEHTGPGETLRGQYDKDLVLEIPSDIDLDTVDISSVCGEVEIIEVEAYELKVKTSDAALKTVGCRAELMSAVCGTGDIALADVMANEMKLITTTGSITAEDTAGYELRLDSVSGNIEFIGSFEKLTGASTEGELLLETDVLPGQISLGSVSGNVSLSIPKDSFLPVTLDSMSGKTDSAFPELAAEEFPEPDEEEKEDEDEDEEETFLRIATTSGNIELTKSEKSVKPAEVFPEEISEDE